MRIRSTLMSFIAFFCLSIFNVKFFSEPYYDGEPFLLASPDDSKIQRHPNFGKVNGFHGPFLFLLLIWKMLLILSSQLLKCLILYFCFGMFTSVSLIWNFKLEISRLPSFCLDELVTL